MKIDLDQQLKTLAGDPIQRLVAPAASEGEEPETTPWTLGFACATALQSPASEPEKITPAEAGARYLLALRLFTGGTQEITAGEATMIQDAANRVFQPLLKGPVITLLNGD
jgi:hypothetical protein